MCAPSGDLSVTQAFQLKVVIVGQFVGSRCFLRGESEGGAKRYGNPWQLHIRESIAGYDVSRTFRTPSARQLRIPEALR